ncbi:FKBP-type peptidyl-prolyl isomerase-like protein [Mangrovibacterium marinum]|uniref:Peptidyl-prolyl cis-trans isomerase n=1 Tax=Mangrovibacterium marinum TaxID=1639118 RepID=A0A2T5BYB6_9BACT|nr:FKBP-type peptidyl-prolyl isomerase-like protein [Mangrovibacterium marinum]
MRNSVLAIGLLSVVACSKDDTEQVVYSPAKEAAEINSLIEELTADGYDVDTTETGVYYTMLVEGDGNYVQPGDSIGISYTGSFANGYSFDSSSNQEDGIWRYVPDHITLIEGFSDAVSHLREGGSGKFIIPSALGYGPNGYYIIPPYTPLIFEIELVAIYPDDTEL